jgi:hypothetical protein
MRGYKYIFNGGVNNKGCDEDERVKYIFLIKSLYDKNERYFKWVNQGE